MQKIILSFFIILALASCSQQVQYGKNPLVLDRFNFNLNVATFFKDESIFRGKSDFSVSSSEITYDDKDREISCIQYSTTSMSRKRILARYGNMDFESLGMVTDSTDEKVLLVSASTDYATAAGLEQVIKKLRQEYGQGRIRHSSFSREGLKLLFTTKDKIIKLVIEGISLEMTEENENTETGMQAFDEKLNTKLLAAIKEKKENIPVVLFMCTLGFDEVLQKATSASGDLVHY